MANEQNPTRRTFLHCASTTVGTSLLATAAQAAVPRPEQPLRVALIGTGSRGVSMWGTGVVQPYRDVVQMVGLGDRNGKRAAYASQVIGRAAGYPIPHFTDFDEMVRLTRPQTIIVATPDSAHAPYVVRAMELGCDVICEKAYGTTADQCQAMHEAEQRLHRRVRVAFNFRYVPFIVQLRRLVAAGEIGTVYSIEYQEFLDLEHGASYYRRWHGYRRYNGSLLVTKASHHFDAINWILQSDPETVVAHGDLKKYGRNGALRHTHCRTCPHAQQCEFYWDITAHPEYMRMYVACESEDGYLRDACLFRQDLDTWDTNSVLVRYASGVQMTYSLTAAAPYEGQRVTLTGSKGRIMARLYTGRQGWREPHGSRIRLARNRQAPIMIYPTGQSGGHGGADPQLKDHLFRPAAPDPLAQRAGSRAGILSSLVGIAACQSIKTGQPVRLPDLMRLV